MAKAHAANWHIEPLRPAHNRDVFFCGKSSLDDFIQRYASQYESRDLARVYVATRPPETRVLGYYTLSAGAVGFSAVPAEWRKKLPRHPVPVAHLGRLAVDRTVQGQGLGAILLLDALARCARFSEQMGFHAVEVYALDDEARKFYLKYGFISLADDPSHLYLPMKAIRKLGLES